MSNQIPNIDTDRNIIISKDTKSKMIARGEYGCIYYPAMNCKEELLEDREKYITKVQIDDIYSKNEVAISEKIKQIPFYNYHFAPVISSCSLNISELDKGVVKECHILSTPSHNNYLYMKIKHIQGGTLYDYLCDVLKKSGSKKLMNSIISTYNHMLYNIKILSENQIIHYDLKSTNIMFDTEKNLPIVIDFGSSIDLESTTVRDLPNKFFRYTPHYYPWAPELQFISYLLHTEIFLTYENVTRICSELVTNNKPLKRHLTEEQLKQYTKDMVFYFSKFIGRNREVVLRELLLYYKTWDNFSLSIMYLRLMHLILGDECKTSPFIKNFIQILLQNCNPDPSKRLSLMDTDTQFDNILIASSKDDLKDVAGCIEKLRRNKTIDVCIDLGKEDTKLAELHEELKKK